MSTVHRLKCAYHYPGSRSVSVLLVLLGAVPVVSRWPPATWHVNSNCKSRICFFDTSQEIVLMQAHNVGSCHLVSRPTAAWAWINTLLSRSPRPRCRPQTSPLCCRKHCNMRQCTGYDGLAQAVILPMLAQPKAVAFTSSIACPAFPLTVRRCRLPSTIGLSLGRSWLSMDDRPSAALIMRRCGGQSRLWHHPISSLSSFQIGRILQDGRGGVLHDCAKLVSLKYPTQLSSLVS